MLIIVDKKLPQAAKENLKNYGQLIEFTTSGITYEAISGHPDIFFTKINSKLFAAKNLPQYYFDILHENKIEYILSEFEVGEKYPQSAIINCYASEKYFIHNLKITDRAILLEAKNLEKINISQGYTRCNLLILNENSFITSDAGIHKTLVDKGLNSLFVNPEGIILPGYKHGFFGGVCGIYQNNIFVTGQLKFLSDNKQISKFAEVSGFKFIELYDGPLFDGGTILFIENDVKTGINK